MVQVLHKMFPLVDRPFAKIYISFTESKSKIIFFHMFSFHSPSRERIFFWDFCPEDICEYWFVFAQSDVN